MSTPTSCPARILIEDVIPTLDGGRYGPKCQMGAPVVVSATVIRDGHEILRARLAHVGSNGEEISAPLLPVGGDRFAGSLTPTALGLGTLQVSAWVDQWGSWCEEVRRKHAAGQVNLGPEAAEGARLLSDSLSMLAAPGKRRAKAAMVALSAEDVAPAFDDALASAIEGAGAARGDLSTSVVFPIDVDRERASVGAWYELFPRSFGGLAGVTAQIPRLAGLGFDVIYLPPIHPIGVTNRKGRNNAPTAEPGDCGSPWAIGGAGGGHEAIHPDLGTLADFDALVATASRHGVEIALDLALQCSPDHPWIAAHPEWFERRPDGSIKYAENPPKRYEDIHNLNFSSDDWRGLWDAIREVVAGWVQRGVRIFRVDNPHTKAFGFWEWLIADIRREWPDVVFLAEAFTRPALMRGLGKLGFSQSYTYFTWKNTGAELTEFVELTREWSDCCRPNLFVNTPDILHAYLQEGGAPAFVTRLILAATLSPTYGIYSGFENYENTPVKVGSEEYLDSEKYEIRTRSLDGPLLGLIGRLNAIRRAHPPLRTLEPLTILDTHDTNLFAFAKGRGVGAIIVCVNVDPRSAHIGSCVVPDDLVDSQTFAVRDLLGTGRWIWKRGDNYIHLDPEGVQAHVFVIETA